MASAAGGGGAALRVAAASVCVALVLLLSADPPPAMAADMEYCLAGCGDACRPYANATCRGISKPQTCLSRDLCFFKVLQQCGATCYTGCTSPSPPAGTTCCVNGCYPNGTLCLSM
ncbi:hypothetical protein ACP4OV_009022 [Aristida adscensionis]